MTDQQKRPAIDWEAVQREFRAGQLSVCEIARQHGCTDAAIRKRAKAKGWARDLGDRVRQETRAKLARTDVEAVGSGGGSGSGSEPLREDEARTIELAAERGVAVVREHRMLLRETREQVTAMLAELKTSTARNSEIVEEIEDETAGDKNPQRRNTMLAAVSLPGRVSTLKDLSIALKNLMPLERQAFSLDDEAKDAEMGLGALIEASYQRIEEPMQIADDAPRQNAEK